MKAILGLSALYHDSAAALVIDGEIIAAAQEERFSRQKHDASFPSQAIRYVLNEARIPLGRVDAVAFYDKPFLKFERLLETYVTNAPHGFSSFRRAVPVALREKLFLKRLITKELRLIDKSFKGQERLRFTEHHYSHAASAFFPSPFEEAVVLTLDGVGEWATTSVAIGRGNDCEIVKEVHFPHSIGLLYSAFTYYTGFKVNSGEYKLMGLAPYGRPRYLDKILGCLVDLKEDGSFFLDQTYFNYSTGLTMTNEAFADLFGRPARNPESESLDQFHMDVAASVQKATEEILLTITRHLATEYEIPNLCMAGGVALNCVANGKVLRDGSFENVWIQPAAGDAGGSLGAALAVWHKEFGGPRHPVATDSMKGGFLGPSYSESESREALDQCGAVYRVLTEDEMISETVDAIVEGKTIGWFQGRMEFGPRALGSRSILADPRILSMQRTLNLKVKFRESFRPFAPAVLAEDASLFFELEGRSPYMLLVADVTENQRKPTNAGSEPLSGFDLLQLERSSIPAVTHVDNSARVQTVHRENSPIFYELLTEFKNQTGCPLLINTSFNVRGEPIVESPDDAFRCFMGTDLDLLVIGNMILRKEDQNCQDAASHKGLYEPD